MSDVEETVPIKKSKMTNPDHHCFHWVHRKKRYCKMEPMDDQKYCAEHKPLVEVPAGEEAKDGDRIPCPLDGKHTVYKKNLSKHLKICNAKPVDVQPPYIVKRVNAGDCNKDDVEDFTDFRLGDLNDTEFKEIIEKVRNLYDRHVNGQIETLNCKHTLLDEELAKPEYGKESKKHLVQAAAMLGILETENQLQNATSYVEFGAGKGQLAFYLAQLLEKYENSQVVLVDRMSLRHKKDNKIEDRSLVHRIRADIVDFCMQGLELIRQSERYVAVSKHLCGGATDLSLRCITQAAATSATDSSGTTIDTDFIMIALCCHHRCDWRSFVGKEFFRSHQLTPRDFVIVTKMSCWATCGTGFSRERLQALKMRSITPQESLEQKATTQRLTLAEREDVGLKCKRLLDFARLEYLRRNGYEATLKFYVPKDVTPENVCLLARKSRSQKK